MLTSLFNDSRFSTTILVTILLCASSVFADSGKIIYSFQAGTDGTQPIVAPITDGSGNLYGTTLTGGTSGWGTIYELVRGSGGTFTEKLLYEFQAPGGTGGYEPTSGLVFDHAGNLYGTALAGGGLFNDGGEVYELSPGSNGQWTFSVLYVFSGGSDGGDPSLGNLLMDSAGNLYGSSGVGGNTGCANGFGCGVVFKLSPAAGGQWTDTTLYTFTGGNDGAVPNAGLVLDSVGNLYGTASEGGSQGDGVVFELTPNSNGSWTESVLHTFAGTSDGAKPYVGLTFDTAGNLYGTTYSGGNGAGTIFELSKQSNGTWDEKILLSFIQSNGNGCESPVTFDAQGRLYTTTEFGGGVQRGTVLRLTPGAGGTWSHLVLYRFLGQKDGGEPVGGLTFVPATGTFYGTASYYGANGWGEVFEILP